MHLHILNYGQLKCRISLEICVIFLNIQTFRFQFSMGQRKKGSFTDIVTRIMYSATHLLKNSSHVQFRYIPVIFYQFQMMHQSKTRWQVTLKYTKFQNKDNKLFTRVQVHFLNFFVFVIYNADHARGNQSELFITI